MRAHADGAHARATAAVGNAEGLVQVEVGDVGAELTGGGDAYQGVEVGAVDVDLAAVFVDDLAQFDNGLLEHPVGRGVGHHDAGQVFPVAARLVPQVVQVDVAQGVALDDHHLHARQRGAGRIGAMGRGGNQADIALGVAAALVVAANRQ